MVEFGESDKMKKISGKVDKSKLTTGLIIIFCSFFTELLQTKHIKEIDVQDKDMNSLYIIYPSKMLQLSCYSLKN